MKELLRDLCLLDGVPGYEEEVADYITEKAKPYADELIRDELGNVLVFKKGAQARPAPVMLCAHIDEVGFLVCDYTSDGMLMVDTAGGIDPRVLIGRRMRVGKDKIRGVISLKAIHLTTAEERKSAPPLERLYIDIGASGKEEAQGLVQIGDPVTFDSAFIEFGDGCIKAKAIDDRLGCAVMLTLLSEPLPYDTWFAFTTNEETNGYGAKVAAQRIVPAYCATIEATTAADMPDVPKHLRSTSQRCGAAVSIMDGGTIYDRALRDRMTDAATREGVKWQYRASLNGATDASRLHLANEGCRAFGISNPTRYIHCACNVAYWPDCEEVLKLARLFIKETGEM